MCRRNCWRRCCWGSSRRKGQRERRCCAAAIDGAVGAASKGALIVGFGSDNGFIVGAGISRQFRIVKDNRVNPNSNKEITQASNQSSTSTNELIVPNVSNRGKIPTTYRSDQKHLGPRNLERPKSSQTSNGPSFLGVARARDGKYIDTNRKGILDETRARIQTSSSQVQGLKSHSSRPYSPTLASNTSVVGLYFSSSDPVHVPSPDSRSSGVVGAIKREVGVVGVRRQPSDNSGRNSSVLNGSVSNSLPGMETPTSSESVKPSVGTTKMNERDKSTTTESAVSSISVNKAILGNQQSSRQHPHLTGHQKASQFNMEWKPKSSQKSTISGVTGTSATPILSLTDDFAELEIISDQLKEKLSEINLSGDEHVIIPQHLRVLESERVKLTFGSFGAEFDSNKGFLSQSLPLENAEHESTGGHSASVSAPSTSSEDVNQVDLLDVQDRQSGSGSPASAEAADHPFPDKEYQSPRNLEGYVDIGLVRNDSLSYTQSEPQQRQDHPEMLGFQAYDSQSGYDMPFFRQTTEESFRGQGGVPSPAEALGSHTSNSIPASTVGMVQQQQMAQMYPQVHLSHYPNYMPYRQYVSPVFVPPPMAMPGYSSSPAYPHPSSNNAYMLMPGGNSHLSAGGLKYGTTQYKPFPGVTPTGFGSYTNGAGYAVNAQGTVGGATSLEDSTRIKYKEGNLYAPNPQAETSEMWIQPSPRDITSMQSAPYYNLAGQGPHAAAYMQSHTGHASYNVAAAAQQNAHVQFPGLYHHPSPQQAPIPNPHHMVPGNVGVSLTPGTPGSQTYQQPQLGHINWTTNF
ncbi:hypothetical protein GIB67_002378 [Kingdonia uniflora]|uniref:GBF-interacting protein 1 N-terminal domain-containing protein n=1 Tax=Kingdonia uniflora TaxID=39325 RepID=A0A7J7M8D1_9MAGN|nr:hypothetical protein GIB67_002378 [Kingdonia uniflora]